MLLGCKRLLRHQNVTELKLRGNHNVDRCQRAHHRPLRVGLTTSTEARARQTDLKEVSQMLKWFRISGLLLAAVLALAACGGATTGGTTSPTTVANSGVSSPTASAAGGAATSLTAASSGGAGNPTVAVPVANGGPN